ncbi:hypothetical protein CS063_06230 [Sporanaerobium hydrogeniformans]|uniref:Uncharacterized protein n=1 Tax=Sporanaerobium hydrogeniformans TaxID=3072179 RepID=A0AC61DEG0_9FIRM|nr:hypothetical protein [Sporanaerobium hydrogeniformans]PHV71285.1 hypothetical protein CS063_06230 [Sporanaerobium hydrogeniformans]
MKKRTKILLGVILLATISTVYAAQYGAGTSEDPVVTKSYVDQKIAELSKQNTTSTTFTYEVMSLEPGQILLGKQGTEIIMRSGEGQVIGSEAGGVQNITAGSDIANGKPVPKYHLLLIPRDDGRGIIATKQMYVMVRGGYVVQ